MHEQLYHFGPFTLQVWAAQSQHLERLQASWRQLFRVEPTGELRNPCVQLTFALTPANESDLALRQTIVCAGPIRIWRTADGFQCTCGATAIQIRLGQRQIAGYLAPDFWDYTLVEQRDFWQRVFFLLVQRVNCYLLHANALYSPAHGPADGVLVVGDCGAGKTTLTLSLISSGWGYVADDSILLQTLGENQAAFRDQEPDIAWSPTLPLASRPLETTLIAHAVRRGFACTQQTVAQWPWLTALQATGIRLNRVKTLIDPDSLYPGRFAPACRPRLLLFPYISGDEQSCLHRLNPTQSFTRLLGQPRTAILLEPTVTPVLLAIFRALVQQTQGYQLSLGKDVLTHPERVSALFSEALAIT